MAHSLNHDTMYNSPIQIQDRTELKVPWPYTMVDVSIVITHNELASVIQIFVSPKKGTENSSGERFYSSKADANGNIICIEGWL